jgi:radical SAM superfamily enzyme YgiQ (UPF0313 family)
VLVYPRLKYFSGDPPLGVSYLASAFRKKHPEARILILDGMFFRNIDNLEKQILSLKPDLMGISSDSLSLADVRRLGNLGRQMKIRTIAGGPLATVSPFSLTDYFDVVMKGEGEDRFADAAEILLEKHEISELSEIKGILYRSESGEIIDTGSSWDVPGPDSIPFPAWDLLQMEDYIKLWPYLDSHQISTRGTNVLGSRGCPWKCRYCQPALNEIFGNSIRLRSVESILEEIKYLQKAYGIRGVFFHDDNLTTNRNWLIKLCERLNSLEKKISWGCNSRVDVLNEELINIMAHSGLKSIHLGIESGSERIRTEILDKKFTKEKIFHMVNYLDQADISSLGFFMLGSPTETFRELLSTINLAVRLNLTETTFSLVSVLPGTYLHKMISEDPEMKLKSSDTIDYYNSRNFTDRTSGYPEKFLKIIQRIGLFSFYFFPKRIRYIGKHFQTKAGLKKLMMKMARFYKIAGRLSRPKC